jgi:hypothetical protein
MYQSRRLWPQAKEYRASKSRVCHVGLLLIKTSLLTVFADDLYHGG